MTLPVTFSPADTETEPYDEFALVAENAAEMSVDWPNRHHAEPLRGPLAIRAAAQHDPSGVRQHPRSCSCTAVARTRTPGTA